MSPALRLARWLGPWTPETARPRRVERRRLRIDGRFDAWIYRPRRAPVGAMLVLPGLHYLGPADTRLDRFLAILADAGILVLSPFLPELRALRVGQTLLPDAEAAWDALLALDDLPPGVAPGVFSISFGSYPAIHLAASRDVGALTLFGAYSDFADAIRFSMGGDADRDYDPLNRPVLFLNLIDHLDGVPADPEPLRRAWITYVRRTWGRPEMKLGAWEEVAREMSSEVPADARALFDLGTGLTPGGPEVIARALERARFDHLEVRPVCARVRCPTFIIHGRDDDVIPCSHSVELAERIPHAQLLLTGLYSHTGHGAVGPRALLDEGRTMLGILRAITHTAGC